MFVCYCSIAFVWLHTWKPFIRTAPQCIHFSKDLAFKIVQNIEKYSKVSQNILRQNVARLLLCDFIHGTHSSWEHRSAVTPNPVILGVPDILEKLHPIYIGIFCGMWYQCISDQYRSLVLNFIFWIVRGWGNAHFSQRGKWFVSSNF